VKARLFLWALALLGPHWTTRLALGYATFSFLIRQLIGTAWGVLLLSIALYFFEVLFSSSPPWSGAQLAVWIAELPTDAKSALGGAVITVGGFLLAFHAASNGWKSEAKAQLHLAAAKDHDELFSEAIDLAISTNLYVAELLRISESLRTEGVTRRNTVQVREALRKQPEFHSNRVRIGNLVIQAGTLRSRHGSVLNTMWAVPDCLRAAALALDRVAQTLWVGEPTGDPDDPVAASMFVDWVDVEKCEAAMVAWERELPLVSGLAGAARGVMIGEVIDFNIPALLRLLQIRKSFPNMLKHMQGNLPPR